ncbi:RING/U-box superfamily protein [Wolffia australiana]
MEAGFFHTSDEFVSRAIITPALGENDGENPLHSSRHDDGNITHVANVSSTTPSAAIEAALSFSYPGTREETWGCVVVMLTFWSFAASMIVILGFYGSANLVLSPNSSRIISANSLFVQNIKLQSDTDKQRAELYLFSKKPPLDIEVMWSQGHNISLREGFHKEWTYYLNEGSQISVSYNVNSFDQGPASLILVIFEGEESPPRWITDPLFPLTTLSWNIINGSGLIRQIIPKSMTYIIGVGNLYPMAKEVELIFVVDALLYNTTGAAYKCALCRSSCVAKLSFLHPYTAVFSTSDVQQYEDRNELFVKLSYEPRWITYITSSASLCLVIVLASRLICPPHDTNNPQAAESGPERMPLLRSKDDDVSSLGSSYDSVSEKESDIEAHLDLPLKQACSSRWSKDIDPRFLCTVCLDATKDCFFLPCGDSATCFNCGTRIIEDSGTCPLCHRRGKKVKRIFLI